MSDEFRRQRRALMVSTSLVVLLKFLRPNLMKVTMMGVQFEFTHVSRLYIALWLFLLYNIIRYYQYYRHDGLAFLLNGWKSSWTTAFSSRIQELATPRVKEHPGYLATKERGDSLSLAYTPESLKSADLFYYEYNSGIIDLNTGQYIKVRFPKYKFVREMTKAVAHYLRNRPQFLDVQFPFLYVAFAIWYCNTGCWDGSMLKLLKLVSCA